MVVTCIFCGRSFRTKKALFGHLQFCAERKKKKDQWHRYPVVSPKFEGDLCVISRSPKTLVYVSQMHKRLVEGQVSPEGFWGYIIALSDQKLLEYKTEISTARADRVGTSRVLDTADNSQTEAARGTE